MRSLAHRETVAEDPARCAQHALRDRGDELLAELAAGDVVEIIATHPDSETDIPSWCRRSGNTLVHSEVTDSTYHYYVRKHA